MSIQPEILGAVEFFAQMALDEGLFAFAYQNAFWNWTRICVWFNFLFNLIFVIKILKFPFIAKDSDFKRNQKGKISGYYSLLDELNIKFMELSEVKLRSFLSVQSHVAELCHRMEESVCLFAFSYHPNNY